MGTEGRLACAKRARDNREQMTAIVIITTVSETYIILIGKQMFFYIKLSIYLPFFSVFFAFLAFTSSKDCFYEIYNASCVINRISDILKEALVGIVCDYKWSQS